MKQRDIDAFISHTQRNRARIEHFNRGGMAPERIIIHCMDLRDDPHYLFGGNPEETSPDFGRTLAVPTPGTIVRPKTFLFGGTLLNSYLTRGVGKFKVRDITVLGHSDCSAIYDLLHGTDSEDEMTFLQFAQNALNITEKRYGHLNLPQHDFLTHVAEETVLLSARNLETYPIIKKYREEITIESVMYDPREHTLRQHFKDKNEWKIVADASERSLMAQIVASQHGHAHGSIAPGDHLG